MAGPQDPYIVLVDLRIRSGARKEFLAALEANAMASLSSEPGCLRFEAQQDRLDEDHFVLYEVYRDQEAFEVGHRSAPHYERWQESASRLVVPQSQVNTYLRSILHS